MVRFIERTQPYKRSPQPKEHPLWLLHTLDVIDKHREPHVALAALSSLMILPTEEEIPAFVGPLEPGTELSRIPVRQTQVEQRPFIDVVFRDLPVRTWPVTWVLGDVLVEVGVVLERFREAFFKSADGTLPNFDPLNPPRDRPPTGTG